VGRLTPDDAEHTAAMIELLFEELNALRYIVHEQVGEALLEMHGATPPERVNEAAVRVALLNLMDVATEQDLKGTALTEMPEEHRTDEWEWLPTVELVAAMNVGFGAMVRDLSTLRTPGMAGRELDVQRFRMCWDVLKKRLINGDGATLVIVDGEGGEIDMKVHFEPPMSNPFKADNPELTPTQVLVGNMMSYAFTRANDPDAA
jgi:hypothetical protein